MKKQNLIKKMIIALIVFIISIQSVNANENKSNDLSQKFKEYFNFFQNHIKREIKEIRLKFKNYEFLVKSKY